MSEIFKATSIDADELKYETISREPTAQDGAQLTSIKRPRQISIFDGFV